MKKWARKKICVPADAAKVEYSLKEYGVTANKIVDVMCSWGKENIKIRQQGEEIILLEVRSPENILS
ncbi:winged helix-turn-helix transcriptional regulator [Paenibacillus motobuensis]|uniref:HTH hxlR-type domain-containing protein n=1 Tax=Paenibacillus motobuensis TaxID=295324 RepID=A0ABN0Y573_9BACL